MIKHEQLHKHPISGFTTTERLTTARHLDKTSAAEEEQYVAEKTEKNKNKVAEHQAKIEEYNTLKASAKAKLIAGEALTEDEANTIVL